MEQNDRDEKRKVTQAAHGGSPEFDVCVTGCSTQGYHQAEIMAKNGQFTAFVADRDVQSDCCPAEEIIINALSAATMAATSYGAYNLGLLHTKTSFDWAAIQNYIKQTRQAISPHYSFEKLEGHGVQIVAPDTAITAKQTHDFPVVKNIPECLKDIDAPIALNLREIHTWASLPESLIILGETPRTLELAQIFANLGVKLFVVFTGNAAPDIDAEIYDIFYKAAEKDGVRIIQNADIRAAHIHNAKIKLDLFHDNTDRGLSADHILICENTPPRAGMENVGSVMSTQPPMAQAGITERQAIDTYGPGNFDITKWRYRDCEKAYAEGHDKGLMKIITRINGQIVGAGICGAYAHELGAIWTYSIHQKMTMASIAELDLPTNTYASMIQKSAQRYAQISNPNSAQNNKSPWQNFRRLIKNVYK